jgi:protein SCO1/2
LYRKALALSLTNMKCNEAELNAWLDAVASGPGGCASLIDLLREDQTCYAERGVAAVNRIRASILERLAARGLPSAALPFVLEELDSGSDPWLVAVSARALRAFPESRPEFARVILDAIQRVRYRDQVVPDLSGETSVIAELVRTLEWLGTHTYIFRDEIEALHRTLPKKHRAALKTLLRSTGTLSRGDRDANRRCCSLGFIEKRFGERLDAARLYALRFEDQDGCWTTFEDLFVGQPSVVVFFYTRCDNPLKCSLSIANLGTVQRMLAQRGLADRIRTVAITYDPAFDSPSRLRSYGAERGFRTDATNRMLRAPENFGLLRQHFGLGVNFIGSVVNRHRIELYVLDKNGRVAATFERIRWDPQAVVERAADLLDESKTAPNPDRRNSGFAAALASGAPVILALLPKCPACWAAYLGFLGIAGIDASGLSVLQPLLIGFVLLNVAGVILRSRVTGQFGSAILVATGAILILLWRAEFVLPGFREGGMALTFAGSLWSVLGRRLTRA